MNTERNNFPNGITVRDILLLIEEVISGEKSIPSSTDTPSTGAVHPAKARSLDVKDALYMIYEALKDHWGGGGGSSTGSVSYEVAQTLTATQRATARNNIGAANAAFVPSEASETNKLADKNFVENLIAELEGKILKFKGFVSPNAPTGTIKNGSFWYQGNAMPSTFPIDVKTYNSTTGQWSSPTSQYTPEALDLWANLNDDKGYYWFGNAWNMLDDNGKVMYVSTFTGLAGDQKMLYYLDTAYDDYKVGFYRFIEAAGTEPAKFVPLDADVFTDVDELPDTGISKKTIYRIPYLYYEYQGMKVEKEDAVWYGPGALCLNMACDNTNGLSLETASQSYQYPLADITDVLVQQLITDQLIQAKSTGTDAPMFKVAANSYCPSEDVTEVDGGYKLYHNPTETDGQYIEIGGGDTETDGVTIETVGGKLRANAIIDVATLPDSDILPNTIYRMLVDKYYEDGAALSSVPTGYVSIRPAIVIIDENGITDNGTFYAWADITDAQMDFWVIRRQISQVYAADLMTNSTCFKTATNHYVYKDRVTKDQVYELYHNPTQAAGGYIKIGGESVESPFVAGTGTNSAVLKGGDNVAEGDNSVAEGRGTKTTNQGEHAEGRFNRSYKANADEDGFGTQHSVGVGTSDSDRKNAVEVLANGEMFIKGAGNYDGTDMRQGTGVDMKINPDVKSVQKLLSQIPTEEQKLTVNASGESVLSVNKVGSAPVDTMEYSLDGKEWTSATLPFTVVFTDSIHLRGNAQSCADSFDDYVNIDVQGGGGNQKEFTVEGNIMALLYGSNIYGKTELPTFFSFAKLFAGTKITSVSGLKLPADKLTLGCYLGMFMGCSELNTSPALPATVLAQSCYQEMFKDCTSLNTAPSLPATTVADSCYNYMFDGCTSLLGVPSFPSAVGGDTTNFCRSMFRNCSAIVNAPVLPSATSLNVAAYAGMFQNCTSLRSAPALPAMSVGNNCYQQMFQGCTSLQKAPALPAITLGESCYANMFESCSALTEAPELNAETLAPYCYYLMFNECASLQRVPAIKAKTLANDCFSHMFKDCTSLAEVPVLPAKVLPRGCYNAMFAGCSVLDEITILAEDISAVDCLTYWLGEVAATGTFRKKPGVAFTVDSPDGIPVGWTVEEISEETTDVFTDVDSLPDAGISKNTIYRTRDVSYEYEGVRFPKSELTLYGPGPDCTSMDADDVGLNIRAASGNRSYPWGTITIALIQELSDLNLVAVGVDEADAVFFSNFATYGPKSGLTTIYGDYHIYHNPSETAGGYIEIGGDAVQYVSTFEGVTGDASALYYLDTAYGSYKKGFYRFNGTFQFIGTDVILTVDTLPTTDISDSVFYRLVEYHKYDNGWEIPVENTFMSNSPRMVISASGLEYTDTQSQIHPYLWADVTDDLVTGWMAGGELVNVPLSDRNLVGKFYKKEDGTYDAMNGATAYVYIRNEYKLYQNPTKTSSGYLEVGGGGGVSGKLDKLTTVGKYAYVHNGDTQGEAEITETISEDTASHDKLPTEKAVRDADKAIEERIDNVEFVTAKALNDLNDRKTEIVNVTELPDTGILSDVLYRLVTTSGGVTTYKLYHNPTKTNTGWIEIGGDSEDAIIVVNTLPTTGIKTNSLYRRMETVYKHDGVEVPNVTMYKVALNDTIEATPEGMRYKPSGPVVAWNDANIGAVIQQGVTDGYVVAATWDDAEFFAYGDGEYDYESHFSRILPGSLWQNTDGTAAGWKEVGGEPAIDEVTIVQEHGVLQAVAVIDVTTLPSAGMKANALYRKVETVMVPGLHIYTTYYHGGADPVPEPVECYKPARAGVEFRTNEIYIDSVEHSYEELRVYKADWVAAGYIVACDFLDIDTTTYDGAVGYPNEGSYQFLNRERYTYNTDPVPVVMNKIFQYTPSGGWESISTVQLSNAAYNELDYEQKMDGTTYIVEG
jgi:hypothetical protein